MYLEQIDSLLDITSLPLTRGCTTSSSLRPGDVPRAHFCVHVKPMCGTVVGYVHGYVRGYVRAMCGLCAFSGWPHHTRQVACAFTFKLFLAHFQLNCNSVSRCFSADWQFVGMYRQRGVSCAKTSPRVSCELLRCIVCVSCIALRMRDLLSVVRQTLTSCHCV